MNDKLRALNHSPTAETAVMSIGFWWLGLTCAPGSGPFSEILVIGLVGTVAAILGFSLVAFLKRDPKRTAAE